MSRAVHPPNTAEQQKAHCRGDPDELAAAPATLLRKQITHSEARRDRSVRLREGCAQRLSLRGILRPPLPRLGMGREIPVDGLGTFGGRATIDTGL